MYTAPATPASRRLREATHVFLPSLRRPDASVITKGAAPARPAGRRRRGGAR